MDSLDAFCNLRFLQGATGVGMWSDFAFSVVILGPKGPGRSSDRVDLVSALPLPRGGLQGFLTGGGAKCQGEMQDHR